MSSQHIEIRVGRLERAECCSKIYFYDSFSKFPTKGRQNVLYIDKESGVFYTWKNERYEKYLGADNTLISLTDVPSSYQGESGKILKVKNDESGIEFKGFGPMAYESADDYLKHQQGNAEGIIRMCALTPSEFGNLSEYVKGTLYIIPDNKEGKLAINATQTIDLW